MNNFKNMGKDIIEIPVIWAKQLLEMNLKLQKKYKTLDREGLKIIIELNIPSITGYISSLNDLITQNTYETHKPKSQKDTSE